MQPKQQHDRAFHRRADRRARIRRVLRSAVAVAAVLALSACGVVEDVIGPQQIANPLGIDGRELTLHPAPGTAHDGAEAARRESLPPAPSALAADGVAPQQTRGYAADVGPVPVPDIAASGIPGWFDPDALTVDVGFRSTVVVASELALSGDAFPEAIVFERATIAALTVADGSGQPRVEVPPVSTPDAATVSLAKVDCGGVVPFRCTYAAQAGLDAFVIPLGVEGSRMDDLYAILTGGSSSNQVDGRFELSASGALPDDVAITITLHAPTGTLDP